MQSLSEQESIVTVNHGPHTKLENPPKVSCTPEKLSRLSTSEANYRQLALLKTSQQRPRRGTIKTLSPGGWREQLADAIFGKVSEMCITSLVLLNIVLMVVELELENRTRPSKMPHAIFWLNFTFNFLFLVEFTLKLVSIGPVEYFMGFESSWNIVDFILVGLSFFDFAVSQMSISIDVGQARIYRLVRIARIFRAAKMVRILRFVNPLRVLVVSISKSMNALFWTLVLIFIIILGHALIFTQASIIFCKEEAIDKYGMDDVEPDCHETQHESLSHYYHSTAETIRTLFMVIVNGVSWEIPYMALEPLGEIFLAFFIFYIIIMYFAVLNVVTAMFCQTAMMSAHEDHERYTAIT
eukprot:TRINITY_DN20551_c0_g1_i1.p1 TRINITY_DN20551_c0_g1~~TRINITY_DN20551_c0_g1_i1.p1  ORF type:complete len:354 (+),score=49.75 TRINITY_DN20551_c0_g1_i1:117-1178(+)